MIQDLGPLAKLLMRASQDSFEVLLSKALGKIDSTIGKMIIECKD